MTDIPANATTTATFLGDPLTLAMANGELDGFGDEDWIAVTLLAGYTYSFIGSTQGYGPGGGDSFLTLYAPDGVTVIDADDDDAAGVNSFIRYTNDTTAVYFIAIKDISFPGGDWSLGVTSVGISPEDHGFNDETGTTQSLGVIDVWGKGRDSATDYHYAMGEQGDDTMDGADGSPAFLSGGIGNDSITGGNGNDRLFGDSGHDYISAGLGNDTVYGGDGADGLFAGEGDDQIYGGAGADDISDTGGFNRIFGEGGNDRIYAGDDDDFVSGGAGEDWMDGGVGAFDTVDYSEKTSAVRVTLAGDTEVTVFVGGVAEDTISRFEVVFGGAASDKLKGDGLANRLYGNRGRDTLGGGDGNDTLNGGLGKDALKGGAGLDAFVFDSKLGSGNVDTIFKFKHGVDEIQLYDTVMPKLGPTLTADEFYKAAGASHGHDANDRIVYNTSTGALYYDKDGSGRHDAVKFAVLDNHPTLTFGDLVFFV